LLILVTQIISEIRETVANANLQIIVDMSVNPEENALPGVLGLVYVQNAIFSHPVPPPVEMIAAAENSKLLLDTKPFSLISSLVHFATLPCQLGTGWPPPLGNSHATRQHTA